MTMPLAHAADWVLGGPLDVVFGWLVVAQLRERWASSRSTPRVGEHETEEEGGVASAGESD